MKIDPRRWPETWDRLVMRELYASMPLPGDTPEAIAKRQKEAYEFRMAFLKKLDEPMKWWQWAIVFTPTVVIAALLLIFDR